jgi:hypothetical protein
MDNFIYVLVAKNGLFKIGESGQVKSRLRIVQSNSPVWVEPFFWFSGDRDLEAALHTMFSKKRVRGEWFALDKDDILYLLGLFADRDSPDHLIIDNIRAIVNEMDEWGFFELGKLERFGNAGAEAAMRCSVAMKLDVLEKRASSSGIFGFS